MSLVFVCGYTPRIVINLFIVLRLFVHKLLLEKLEIRVKLEKLEKVIISAEAGKNMTEHTHT